MAVPENAVVVVLLCGVEPQVELLFPTGSDASVRVDVGLEGPISSLVAAKQLDIDLVVVVRVSLCIR